MKPFTELTRSFVCIISVAANGLRSPRLPVQSLTSVQSPSLPILPSTTIPYTTKRLVHCHRRLLSELLDILQVSRNRKRFCPITFPCNCSEKQKSWDLSGASRLRVQLPLPDPRECQNLPFRVLAPLPLFHLLLHLLCLRSEPRDSRRSPNDICCQKSELSILKDANDMFSHRSTCSWSSRSSLSSTRSTSSPPIRPSSRPPNELCSSTILPSMVLSSSSTETVTHIFVSRPNPTLHIFRTLPDSQDTYCLRTTLSYHLLSVHYQLDFRTNDTALTWVCPDYQLLPYPFPANSVIYSQLALCIISMWTFHRL